MVFSALHLMVVETNDAHRSILIGIRVVECPNRKEDA